MTSIISSIKLTFKYSFCSSECNLYPALLAYIVPTTFPQVSTINLSSIACDSVLVRIISPSVLADGCGMLLLLKNISSTQSMELSLEIRSVTFSGDLIRCITSLIYFSIVLPNNLCNTTMIALPLSQPVLDWFRAKKEMNNSHMGFTKVPVLLLPFAPEWKFLSSSEKSN